jgi:hypothetical protein
MYSTMLNDYKDNRQEKLIVLGCQSEGHLESLQFRLVTIRDTRLIAAFWALRLEVEGKRTDFVGRLT